MQKGQNIDYVIFELSLIVFYSFLILSKFDPQKAGLIRLSRSSLVVVIAD